MNENVIRKVKVDYEAFKVNGIKVEVKYPHNPSKEQRDKIIDKALKKFKRKVKDSGVLLEIFNRGEFKKPSVIKKEKRIKSLLRIKAITRANNE